jgi:hypothetical protein
MRCRIFPILCFQKSRRHLFLTNASSNIVVSVRLLQRNCPLYNNRHLAVVVAVVVIVIVVVVVVIVVVVVMIGVLLLVGFVRCLFFVRLELREDRYNIRDSAHQTKSPFLNAFNSMLFPFFTGMILLSTLLSFFWRKVHLHMPCCARCARAAAAAADDREATRLARRGRAQALPRGPDEEPELQPVIGWTAGRHQPSDASRFMGSLVSKATQNWLAVSKIPADRLRRARFAIDGAVYTVGETRLMKQVNRATLRAIPTASDDNKIPLLMIP